MFAWGLHNLFLSWAYNNTASQRGTGRNGNMATDEDEMSCSRTRRKWGNEKQLKMLHRENLFKTQLAVEAEALRKRVAQGRAEQNRARQKAMEMVLQRYFNVKAGMESAHSLQGLKFDREAASKKK